MKKHKHHIVPKHMGGTDDLSNIIELTPEEHAEAHRVLYEKYGKWQDRIAWQGLAGLADKKELITKMLSIAGKMGASVGNKNRKGIKLKVDWYAENNNNAKNYTIINPNGNIEKIKSLKTWCESKGFKYNSFWNATIRRSISFNGYLAYKE